MHTYLRFDVGVEILPVWSLVDLPRPFDESAWFWLQQGLSNRFQPKLSH
jgi:hypothetical protein